MSAGDIAQEIALRLLPSLAELVRQKIAGGATAEEAEATSRAELDAMLDAADLSVDALERRKFGRHSRPSGSDPGTGDAA